MKEFLREYFTFTKKERTGIIILVILIFSGLIVPYIASIIIPEDRLTIKEVKTIIDSNQVHSGIGGSVHSYKKLDRSNYKRTDDENIAKNELFEFDPNNTSYEDWKRLGVKAKTARTILNYVSKGGHFKTASDLSKIYGLRENEVERLIPYVKIQSSNFEIKKVIKEHSNKNKSLVVNINSADSATLVKLPGIGPALSRRILNFRNKLGGFYKVDQISETYGLPDSTFQKLKANFFVDNHLIKKININTATPEDLKSHPYIRYQIANSIVQYRKQHGEFKDVSELKNIMIINDETYEKLDPYLSIQ